MFSSSFDTDVENLNDHACSKFRDIVDPIAVEEKCVCWSYRLRHNAILQCADRGAN